VRPEDAAQVAVGDLDHLGQLRLVFGRAAHDAFLAPVIPLDEVRPLAGAVLLLFGDQLVKADLRDARRCPAGDDLFAFLHVHDGGW